MKKKFGDLNVVVACLDDTLVYFNNEKTHFKHLDISLKRLNKYDGTPNRKKSHILRQYVDHIGVKLTL